MRTERLTVLLLGVLGVACGSESDSTQSGCGKIAPYERVVDLLEAGVMDAGDDAGADAGVDAGHDAYCQQTCPSDGYLQACSVTGTTVTCQYQPLCGAGRRAEGYRPPELDSKDDECAFLGLMAHLEYESVGAFRRLRRELSHYGAPKALVRGAERSARDEVRHYRTMRRMLARRGAVVSTTRRPLLKVREPEAIATENAVEGCVHETYGALLAHRQAARAQDPDMRAAMARIARDETRHAALAWSVARWLDARLTPAARERVRSAQANAALQLAKRAAIEDFPGARRTLGLPDSAEAQRLVHAMAQRLWS